MNYFKIYDALISRAKSSRELSLYEIHHIIPKCLGGTNDHNNLVKLSPREHYIAHMLLVKMYTNNHKLIYALNMMTTYSVYNDRSMNKRYEWIRSKFIKNHPCKNDNIKHKISESLKSYYALLPRKSDTIVTKTCKCGCGIEFYVKSTSIKCYAFRSHAPGFHDSNKKRSQSLKTTLSKLTELEMCDRMNKSMHSADDVERGKRISRGKSGKKTNQQEITGMKYAAMTDDEFNKYISDRSLIAKNRMVKLRNTWILKKLNSVI